MRIINYSLGAALNLQDFILMNFKFNAIGFKCLSSNIQ